MRSSTDKYFLDMLMLTERRATCPRRSVGAILTTLRGQVLSTGYNGPPRGFAHCTDSPCPGAFDAPGDTRRCQAVHAEQNALLQCPNIDAIHTLYVTTTPCFTCAKMLLNTPLQRIVSWTKYIEDGAMDLLLGHIRIFVYEPSELAIREFTKNG